MKRSLRLLPAIALLLLGFSSSGCATPSDDSWIGPEIGRIPPSALVPAPALTSGAATR